MNAKRRQRVESVCLEALERTRRWVARRLC